MLEAHAKEEEILNYFTFVGAELDAVSENNKWIYKSQYTAGLQEWIEAISLMQFLQDPPTLISLPEIQGKLRNTNVHCSAEDYLLGLTDLTGELMRLGINAIGSTGLEDSEKAVRQAEAWVRLLRAGKPAPCSIGIVIEYFISAYQGMSPLSPFVKGLGRKLSVMDQTLLKLERSTPKSDLIVYTGSDWTNF